MYIERTNYYAKPGMADQVLAVRRNACAVRAQLGLPVGAVYTKADAGGAGPDVSWECRFATIAAQEHDMAIRQASAGFSQVRNAVGKVIDRFERHLSRADDAAPDLPEIRMAGARVVPEQVSFKSGDATLAGFLYLPPGPGPFPCVITNHGSAIEPGTSDLCRPGTASLLLSWGFASFLPHRAGYGSSPGTPWLTDVPAEFGTPEYSHQLAARMDSESEDVIAALDWACDHPAIDPARIAVMGSSFGGTVTLLAAAKTDRFTCAVEFAGAAINWDHTPELRQVMKSATRSLTRPIFLLQAQTDYSVGPTRELGQIATRENPDSQSLVYPAFGISQDEGHYFEKYGSLIWGPDVRQFLVRWT